MADADDSMRRALTHGERFVLQQIQDMYGPQNSENEVFFSDLDEAVIFVTDRRGVQGMVAVLTNLASMYEDGTIRSVEELRSQWLTPGDD